MRRKINLSVGEYYHIYNRGTDKREIFMAQHDYARFLALLYVCNSVNIVNIANHLRKGRSFSELFDTKRDGTLVDIGAYCLMPNHFHLLIREKQEGGITLFMKKLLTAYSMYFNQKNARTGALFEGRFKSKHVDSDEYLKYLFSYIHLNPVKIIDPDWKENGIKDREKAKEYLEKYQYSSYHEYMGMTRQESGIVRMNAFPEYFIKPQDFIGFLDDWLFFKDKQLEKLEKGPSFAKPD